MIITITKDKKIDLHFLLELIMVKSYFFIHAFEVFKLPRKLELFSRRNLVDFFASGSCTMYQTMTTI